MILVLIILPALAGLLAFFSPPASRVGALAKPGLRRGLLLAVSLAHAALVVACWIRPPRPVLGGWLAIDAPGLLFLSITSGLFLMVSLHLVGYLGHEADHRATDVEEGFLFNNAPEAIFIGCLLLFLAAMTLVTVSQHFGLLWVAIEATTLASAPLIYFHRHHRSLEATWKYLLICSVGIALALLGNFFLAVAATPPAQAGWPMLLSDLVTHAGQLQRPWLKAATLLLFVGYGTKMGLAPLHTWLPDAHGEAPSAVSALLSGALLNCAFLGLVRMQQVCVAAGLTAFSQEVWLALGLVSLLVAALSILAQTDYKRLLAYSSVENMGLLAIGVGLGGVGIFGAMLQAVNHALVKAMLFLLSGNILARSQSKTIADVRGLLTAAPATGWLWIVGFLALCGLPPFGMFLSELTILKAAFTGSHLWVAGLVLALLAVIFIRMIGVFPAMAQGRPEPRSLVPPPDRLWQILPPAILGLAVLWLGVNIPAPLNHLLHQVTVTLGGAS